MYFCIKSSSGAQGEVSRLLKGFKPHGSTDVGPGVSLTLYSFVVYSTRQFIFSLSLCLSNLLALRFPRLGKGELASVLFVRLFGLRGFVSLVSSFLLVSGIGCD